MAAVRTSASPTRGEPTDPTSSTNLDRPRAIGGARFALDPSAPSLESYLRAFSATPSWDDLPDWPPDVFALANLVLDRTEIYRFVVAPPSGKTWPPRSDWNDWVSRRAREWASLAGRGYGDLPIFLKDLWAVVTEHRDVSLKVLRRGGEWKVCEALLTLHALADEAASGLAAQTAFAPGSFEERAWELLRRHGSLSRLSSARIRITPKMHFATRGMTIRSMSRYLALFYEAIAVRWSRPQGIGSMARGSKSGEYNIVMLPWPFKVDAVDFDEIPGPIAMDSNAFGFFSFRPVCKIDVDRVGDLLEAAREQVDEVDAVFLPEASIEPDEVTPLEEVCADYGVSHFAAGIREPASGSLLGRNYLHMGLRFGDEWLHVKQDKHHRWCLDGPQIHQYHLSRKLDPGKQWWEAIELPPRAVNVLDLGGAMVVPLICEDLARMDEVTDLLRRVGPTLVVAFLLDGPQLATRWPNRYATVLGEDPGSAVLTLTSLGMAVRSHPLGTRVSRSVALWHDTEGGLREIELARGAQGILLTTRLQVKPVWTADGRRHDGNTPFLVLSGTHQLRARHARSRART